MMDCSARLEHTKVVKVHGDVLFYMARFGWMRGSFVSLFVVAEKEMEVVELF